ncbi:hypothetical protein QBC35DRAFT_139874 [Podospora australis]|uniref:BHLH domain-containing protein n=1 Tax=Podospora australis TaxID=1536484 RepID=A0AAN6WMI3_9PEZI|nr:hypothetical protein QBC35DRAFT_139874 [Podospora australis]
MHPISSSFGGLGPVTDTESSFPERHLEESEFSSPTEWPTHHDVTRFSTINLDFAQAALPKLQTFQPSNTHLWSQSWVGQSQRLNNRGHIAAQSNSTDHNILHTTFRQATSPVQTEWDLYRAASGSSPLQFHWNPQSALSNPEDDSESIRSMNDSPEEFFPPLSTWAGTHKIRRRSTHRITKPTRLPVGNNLSHSLGLDKRHTHDSSPDLLDFGDTNFFGSHTSHDQLMTPESATTGNFIIPEEDSAEKVDSKRIAHKLSEKSRRNRLTVAIREIQKLLPSETDREDSPLMNECDLLVRPGVPNSKLDVVEMAIGFIRRLKEENIEMAKRVKQYEAAEKAVAECRCRQETTGEKNADSALKAPATEQPTDKATE